MSAQFPVARSPASRTAAHAPAQPGARASLLALWRSLGRGRRVLVASGLALLALLLAQIVVQVLPLDHWLDRRQDLQAALLAPRAPADAALVVDVDEDSVRRMGAWPLRRDAYVPAGRWLLDNGARAVAFGLMLVDAKDGDENFASWLNHTSAPVLLGARAVPGEGDRLGMRMAPPGCQPAMQAGWQLPRWAEAGLPGALPAARLGALSVPVDEDGVLRHLPLWQQAGDLSLPLLPMAVWQALHPAQADAMRCGRREQQWLVQTPAGPLWALDDQQRVRPWLARADSAPAPLSLWRVDAAAAGRLPADEAQALAHAVRGRVVFLGASAALGGEVLTAQGLRSATTALAAVYDALEYDHMLRPPAAGTDAALLALCLLPWLAMALQGWRGGRARAWPVLGAVAVSLLLLLVVDTALVLWHGQLSRIGAPLATLLAMAGLGLWHAQFEAARETRRLRLQRAELEAANQVKSDFLAHLSHEIRTPLNALLGAAEMLAQTRLDVQQKRHVALFSSAGQDLLHMLNDLLDLSKSEAGLLTLTRHPFSLPRLVAQQVALFEARAQQKGLVLDVETDPDLPETVIGDAMRVGQVLRNLLGNAVKFTPAGTVTLLVGYGRDRQHLRFEVRDTGVGIPADRIHRIFTPYVQADPALAQNLGGTGLGLAICKRLAEAMEGEIGVVSREGMGSCFHVELPLPPTAAAPEGPRTSPQATDSGPLPGTAMARGGRSVVSVLAADDSPHNLMLLQAFVEGSGFRIDGVHDGGSAVRRFEADNYRIVLLDLNMPALSGLEAVRAMRAFERKRHRKPALIVAVSGQSDPSDLVAAKEAGFDAHLGKPYSRAQLLALLNRPQPQDDGPTTRSPDSTLGTDPRLSALDALPDSDLPSALQRLGGVQLYDRVLEAACEPLLKFEQRLERSIDAVPCDIDRAQRLAHDLKSLAATLGLPGLAEESALLERALRDTVSPGEDPAVRRARSAVASRLVGVREVLLAGGLHGLSARSPLHSTDPGLRR
ncbi:hybrid sensor histidine kinase/response regulator [Aquabacterium sp. OR-4]|uniref:hybrid sensor histidine kinase/response regulator n=1 Tax=Aquabacterium sp. OR-4 TaxID=2978127 RepID=UPI0021B4BD85|nr:ATP-binding protein [Aquabacterium sp. OR-4]MDT7835379.1 ATP-binding protein [Aquabacterium sp. OR-4]